MSAVARLLANMLRKKEITQEQIPEKYWEDVKKILIDEGYLNQMEEVKSE